MMQYLSERLNTNYVPTPEESQLLETELDSSFQNVKQIENKVNDLERHLEELKRHRDELDTKVNAYRGMFSPARRLLPDVLQEIFVHCLPVTTNPVMSNLEPPLVFGRVCRQWRYTSYTTPALWSAVHIAVPLDSPFSGTCSHAVRAQAIKSWLSRAGILPLSISFTAPYDWATENHAKDSTAELLLDTIGPYLTRCKSIHISLRNRLWFPFLQKYFKADFPFLQHLNLDAGMANWANTDIQTGLEETSLCKASKLRIVFMVNYGSQAMQLPLPWRQLTTLKLFSESSFSNWEPGKAFQTPDALLLLSWCPNLIFCNVSLSESGTLHSAGLTPSMIVTLPELIGFSVQCDTDPQPFFAQLSTPSLKYFHYRQELPRWDGTGLDGTGRTLHTALRPFIQRVIQPIEELNFNATYLKEDDIISCLELFPELKILTLFGFGSAFDPPLTSPVPPSWDEMNRSSISGRILSRFMRRINPLDISDGCDNTTTESSQIQDESEHYSDSDDEDDFGLSTPSVPCLCPKLERLNINGASFPDTMLLDLIRLRLISYAKLGFQRLLWLSITFPIGREGSSTVLDEVDSIQSETGAFIHVHYTGAYHYPEYQRFSPYNGLASVDSNGDLTHVYIPTFGLMLAPN